MLLSGEPGIGKSRLTATLLERLATEPHTRLRYFCSPQHTDSAFYPIISQLERGARLAHDDTTQTKLDKLDAMLAQTSTSKQDAALFAEMLSLANERDYPALDLEPQQRRQKALEALTARVDALSRQNPLLMIFEDAHWTDPSSLEVFGRVIDRVRLEDAHWTDPTSLEVFGRIVDRLPSLRVLLIVTFRPRVRCSLDWAALRYGSHHQSAGAARHRGDDRPVVGNKLLPAHIRQDIIERTDGIPLFVEEMTKAVLEAGSEDARRTAAAIPSSTVAVPASSASIADGAPRPGWARRRRGSADRSGRRLSFCCGAGRGRRLAKVRWRSSPARRVSGSRGLPLHCWNGLRANRTRACVISVHRSTPIARFILSSVRWNALPDLCTTTPRKRKLSLQ